MIRWKPEPPFNNKFGPFTPAQVVLLPTVDMLGFRRTILSPLELKTTTRRSWPDVFPEQSGPCYSMVKASAGTIPAKSCSCDSDSFGLGGKDSDSIRNRIRVRRAPNFEKMNRCKTSDIFTINFHLYVE
jgi:hypothetical protein